MNITIRNVSEKEYPLLKVFLRDAIEIQKKDKVPSLKLMKYPRYQAYLENFGQEEGDFAFLAIVDESIIGMIWSRIVVGIGSIDEQTPTIIACVNKNYRGKGIGKMLFEEMYQFLLTKGYTQVSCLVEKSLEAVAQFSKREYTIKKENQYEYIMVKKLSVN